MYKCNRVKDISQMMFHQHLSIKYSMHICQLFTERLGFASLSVSAYRLRASNQTDTLWYLGVTC